jgi:hypothetical protein
VLIEEVSRFRLIYHWVSTDNSSYGLTSSLTLSALSTVLYSHLSHHALAMPLLLCASHFATEMRVFPFLLYFLSFVHRAESEESCALGSYRSLKGPWRNGCPGFRLCEKRFYCTKSEKEACPGGTYGDREGLSSSNCSNSCPSGFYCPKQSILPLKCDLASATATHGAVYCPQGSSFPLPIPHGFYGLPASSFSSPGPFHSIDLCPLGFYCHNGLKLPCPPGTYGDTTALTSSK